MLYTSCSVNVRLLLTRQTDDTFSAGTVGLFPEHVQSLVGCKLTEYVELVHTSSFTDCTINDNVQPSLGRRYLTLNWRRPTCFLITSNGSGAVKQLLQRLYAEVPSFTINLVLLQSDRNTKSVEMAVIMIQVAQLSQRPHCTVG